LRLNPSHGVQVEYVNVIKALVAIIATKHVQFASNSAHRVASPGRWLLPADFRLGPDETHRVEQVQIIEPLVTIVAAMEVNFLAVDRSRMVIPTSGLLPERLGLTPADKIVQVKHI